MTRESAIEKRLREKVKEHGGYALKWVSPGCAGVPDRIILLSNGRVLFVELKRPGGAPRALQLFWMGRLAALGFKCAVIDSLAGVDDFIRGL